MSPYKDILDMTFTTDIHFYAAFVGQDPTLSQSPEYMAQIRIQALESVPSGCYD
jgi:hypothetical protein